MKLVAAPRSAILPAIVRNASPMRLLAPPPRMNPMPLAIASAVSGSSLMYSPTSRSRRRNRSSASVEAAAAELFN